MVRVLVPDLMVRRAMWLVRSVLRARRRLRFLSLRLPGRWYRPYKRASWATRLRPVLAGQRGLAGIESLPVWLVRVRHIAARRPSEYSEPGRRRYRRDWHQHWLACWRNRRRLAGW